MFSKLRGLAADLDGNLRAKQSAEQIEKLSQKLDMKPDEHSFFQTKKSLAVANGTLAVEEGQWLYTVLGEQVSVFNAQSAGVKYVATQALWRLLS